MSRNAVRIQRPEAGHLERPGRETLPELKLLRQETPEPLVLRPLEGSSSKKLNKQKSILILASLLAVFQLLDAQLTYMGISRWGLEIEANPLIASLMEHVGVLPALALTKCFAFACILVLIRLGREVLWLDKALISLCFFYGIAAIAPWMMLLGQASLG